MDEVVGKFLQRGAIIDTLKSEERTNALQRRSGQTRYHVHVVSCGCPDENCGAFHRVDNTRPLPSEAEANQTLARDHRQRKIAKRRAKAFAKYIGSAESDG